MEDIILNDPWLNLTYEKKKKSNILIVMAWKLSSIWIYSESFRENKGVGRLYLKLRDFRKVIFEHPTARPESSDDTPWLARDFRVRHYAINSPSICHQTPCYDDNLMEYGRLGNYAKRRFPQWPILRPLGRFVIFFSKSVSRTLVEDSTINTPPKLLNDDDL